MPAVGGESTAVAPWRHQADEVKLDVEIKPAQELGREKSPHVVPPPPPPSPPQMPYQQLGGHYSSQAAPQQNYQHQPSALYPPPPPPPMGYSQPNGIPPPWAAPGTGAYPDRADQRHGAMYSQPGPMPPPLPWQQQMLPPAHVPYPRPGYHTLISDARSCRMAVEQLLHEQEVALDIEGVDLCRHGRVALIQICAGNGHVFLFDITTMGASAFDARPGGGCLRLLLENNNICKVVFDGRNDSDALYHIYWVRMRNLYDLQVLHALKYCDSEDRYLKGFKECLSRSGILAPREQAEANAIKDRGKLLFAPAYGGSYAVWEARPLCQALVDYAVADVRHMLSIKKWWASSQLDVLVRKITDERVDKAVSDNQKMERGQMSLRDFPLPIPQFVS